MRHPYLWSILKYPPQIKEKQLSKTSSQVYISASSNASPWLLSFAAANYTTPPFFCSFYVFSFSLCFSIFFFFFFLCHRSTCLSFCDPVYRGIRSHALLSDRIASPDITTSCLSSVCVSLSSETLITGAHVAVKHKRASRFTRDKPNRPPTRGWALRWSLLCCRSPRETRWWLWRSMDVTTITTVLAAVIRFSRLSHHHVTSFTFFSPLLCFISYFFLSFFFTFQFRFFFIHFL